MASIADYIYDLALAGLTSGGNRLDITSTEATTYAQATTIYTLGNKTSLSVGAAVARSPTGRKVTVAAISNGSVTGNGTAAYWAISDVGNTRLLATGSLSSGQTVSSGNTFTLASFDIGFPAAS